MICALNATHSSQMKTHCESAGLRQPPSMSVRTSCFALPQNEQNICSCVFVRDMWRLQYGADHKLNARVPRVKTQYFFVRAAETPQIAIGP